MSSKDSNDVVSAKVYFEQLAADFDLYSKGDKKAPDLAPLKSHVDQIASVMRKAAKALSETSTGSVHYSRPAYEDLVAITKHIDDLAQAAGLYTRSKAKRKPPL